MSESDNVSLSLQDLALCLTLIDTVVARGAIRGNEMVDVGLVRNKIELFIKQNTPDEEESEED